MIAERTTDDVTCLGCGCACDDIRVVVQSGRIAETPNACHLGRQWFADGESSSNIQADGRDTTLAEAIDAAVLRLTTSRHPLVYLAPGISCEAQRGGAAVADLLRARIDSVTSATALPIVLSAQERGFASATFGEIRNRADVVMYWGIDIERRYPRFVSRYAPGSSASIARRVIAVDVGNARSTVEAVDERLSIAPADELSTLTTVCALVREPASLTRLDSDHGETGAPGTARQLAELLLAGRYAAIVIDAEPDDRAERSSQRFDALLSLSHALNDRTRCALVALRGNGNRSGADSVLTSQTGFPLGVDFSRGYPRYDPYAATMADAVDVVLMLGDPSLLPAAVSRSLSVAQTIVIGPHASLSPLGSSTIAIDTGVAGIHELGTAYRADDVPLPLRAPVPNGLSTADVIAAVARGLLSRRHRPAIAEAAAR